MNKEWAYDDSESPEDGAMKLPHESFKMPPDDTVIWRYMNMAKFLSLVTSKQLYFPSAYEFADPFDGLHPTLAADVQQGMEDCCQMVNQHGRERAIALLRERYTPELVDSYMSLADPVISEPRLLARAKEVVARGLFRFQEQSRSTAVVSCWHINAEQSAAMWDLYLRSGEGIAIRSTVGRLRASLGIAADNMQAAKVLYEDCPLLQNTLFTEMLFYKRRSFEHEAEFRVVAFKPERLVECGASPVLNAIESLPTNVVSPTIKDDLTLQILSAFVTGVGFDVDLALLFDVIYTAPRCGQWVVSAIQSLLSLHSLRQEVLPSRLYDLR